MLTAQAFRGINLETGKSGKVMSRKLTFSIVFQCSKHQWRYALKAPLGQWTAPPVLIASAMDSLKRVYLTLDGIKHKSSTLLVMMSRMLADLQQME